jgi:hypothetical protein
MSQIANIQSLFQSAQDDGVITTSSAQVLNVKDIGKQIVAGMGINVGQAIDNGTLGSSAYTIVSLLLDDTGSVAGNAQEVVNGHNDTIDAMMDSKQRDSVIFHSRALSGQIYTPYVDLINAPKLVLGVYDPSLGHTPLYDQAKIMLGAVIAKAQEFADEGISCRTITLIVTDGDDNSSRNTVPSQLATVVKDMRRQERHIVCGMGINSGYVDFRKIFRSMGLEDQWILTPKNTKHELRQAFNMFSQSAVSVSQAANLSQVSQTGFGSQVALGAFGS